MIGRADIEGSKSYVAMNAWQPQASSLIPCSLQHFLCRSMHPQLRSWLDTLRCSHVSMGGRSYLRMTPTRVMSPHTLPIVETRSTRPCRLLIIPICWIITRMTQTSLTLRCYPRTLGTNSLAGLSSNQVCLPNDPSHHNSDRVGLATSVYHQSTLLA